MLCGYIHPIFSVSFYSPLIPHSLSSSTSSCLTHLFIFSRKIGLSTFEDGKIKEKMTAAKTNYYKNTSSLNLNTVKALRSPSPPHVHVFTRLYVIEGFWYSISRIRKSNTEENLESRSCEMEINVSELKVYISFARERQTSNLWNHQEIMIF